VEGKKIITFRIGANPRVAKSEVFRYQRILPRGRQKIRRTVRPSYNDRHWTALYLLKSSFENEHMHALPGNSPNAIAMTLETTWKKDRQHRLSDSGE
jgi:hypothetical protein